MEQDSHPKKTKKTKKTKETKVKNNDSSTNANENNSEKPTSSKRKPKPHLKRKKKKDKVKEKLSSISNINSDVFVFDELANNKEASALITDLVKCFTCNSNLPQNELDLLNKTLQDKTISVLLNILNNCVEKIFNKLINTEFFKNLICKKQVCKKNAFCQTDDSFDTS